MNEIIEQINPENRVRLKISNAKSEVTLGSINLIEDLKSRIKELMRNKEEHFPFFSLIYNFNKIELFMAKSINEIDRISDQINSDYIKEWRFFSEKSELHLWRAHTGFSYRFREDIEENLDQKKEEDYNFYYTYDEQHLIWGTYLDKDNFLKEKERGMVIQIPFKITESDLPLRYLIRNYFKYDNTGFIQFKDARLIYFIKKDGEVING